MRVASNSSTVSNRKPLASKNPNGPWRDRQVTTIKPGIKSAPTTSWRSRPVPIWCLRLRFWQRRVGITTAILMGGMLVSYGSTVDFQQQWGEKFNKLENLQRQEWELTAANEMLKNQLAVEAEQAATELLPPNPAKAIILQSSKKSNPPLVKPETPPKIDIPSGY